MGFRCCFTISPRGTWFMCEPFFCFRPRGVEKKPVASLPHTEADAGGTSGHHGHRRFGNDVVFGFY